LQQCGSSPPDAAEVKGLLSTFPALARLLSPQASQNLSGVLPLPCGKTGAPTCPPDLTFFRALDSTTNSFFPNNDNKYIGALVQPAKNQVLVIRGAAPTFSPGTVAEPWQPAAVDLRYWSMCSNVYARPYPVVIIPDPLHPDNPILGCKADLDTTLDTQNFYTYVVSHLADKPSDAVLAANSATWLPFSDKERDQRHIMLLRNMLGEDFPHSVQQCNQENNAEGTDPTAIANCKAIMGAFYPLAAMCQASTFNSGGTAACFAEAGLKAK
jgi:hypothetical protein